MQRISGMKLVKRTLTYLVLIVASVWVIGPIYFAFLASIKTQMQTFDPTYIPFLQFQPTLDNWRADIAEKGSEFLTATTNSFVIAVCSTAIVLLLGTLAGYALARFRFERWKNKDIIFYILTLRILPPIAVVIPYFLIMMYLKLLDTHIALILAYSLFNMPFGALLMRASFRDLPADMEESSLVDGCSPFQAFYRIALPLALPALAAAGLLCFAFSWNEFLFAFTLSYTKVVTMPMVITGVTTSTRGVEFWFIGTRTLIAIVPPIVIALIAYRYIVKGLTFGAVKG